jgi:type II secretory pathway pseudopilin PulG
LAGINAMKGGRATRGFSIVEVLISAVLLAVGTVSVLSMFSSGMRADANIERSMVALALAQEEMESIKGAANWNAIDAFIAPRVNMGGEYADFDKEVAVSGDPKLVEVTIYWNAAGKEQAAGLATFFTNYNY